MFKPQEAPRFYALPIGVDFLSSFVDGLLDRLVGEPPEKLSYVEIFVNTRRTERRLRDLFAERGPILLPRIRLITDIAQDPLAPIDLPLPMSQLERRLKLAQLVSALIKQAPDIGPKSSAFELADSLADVLDEMQGEAVSFDALEGLVDDHLSGHWQRALRFLKIVAVHWQENTLTDTRDRQRSVAQAYSDHWRDNPPAHPILIVGSTGSRGETSTFMKAVSALPQGAVVLPGVDQDMPVTVWNSMESDDSTLDHPQAVMERVVRSVGLKLSKVPLWHGSSPIQPDRNALVSLALRPAPVTDQWLNEGPKISDTIATALKHVDVIEAPSPQEEANAIALRLRKAVAQGVQSVLITPNRVLARRVTTVLEQSGIVADDSGGEPVHLTPPGIFLRLSAESMNGPVSPAKLVTLLKHPLTHSGEDSGQTNRLFAREMEMACLRGRGPVIDFAEISNWVERHKDPNVTIWFKWIKECFDQPKEVTSQPLTDWIQQHKEFAERIAGGQQKNPSELWAKRAGEAALRVMDNLAENAAHGGEMSAYEYRALLHLLLSAEEVREPSEAHPLVSIWGTLEARVQGADLVILGGLNEGVWPKQADPDPWLNRSMRKELGLLLPERQTGLSAHDFQQAISAKEVVLSRAARDGDSPTIPSRWVIRLFNLINGLGKDAKSELEKSIARGDQWIKLSRTINEPKDSLPKSTRPSPMPPASARPRKLSVTKIETLIRNPYEIYARYILNLRKLNPLGREADALARGIAFHSILEKFVDDTKENWPKDPRAKILADAEKVLQKAAPWPAARRLWLARLALVADWLIEGEQSRRDNGTNIGLEREGQIHLGQVDFTLTVKADRLDELQDGLMAIYDYKASKPPSDSQIKEFNKQLYLEALIATKGGFDKIAPKEVGHLEFIGLDKSQETTVVETNPDILQQVEADLVQLLTVYMDETKGFTARDRVLADYLDQDFDHLSRRGEWQDSDPPDPKVVP